MISGRVRRGAIALLGSAMLLAACSSGATDNLESIARPTTTAPTGATTPDRPTDTSDDAEADEPTRSDSTDTREGAGDDSGSGTDTGTTTGDAEPVLAAAPEMALRVDGNRMVDTTGATVRLRGVNFSGTEYACAQGWGFFDGHANQDTIDVMQSWGVNAVRIQLHEHCWLGRNGAPAEYSGQIYRDEILRFVDLLGHNGMYVIVGLSRGGPGTVLAQGGEEMPNRDNSIDFWRSVGELVQDRPHVIFGLYGEPHEVDWECWISGCEIDGWSAVGMQELVDTVRSTGAPQILMIGGIEYANDLSRWLELQPRDPLENIVADAHIYSFNVCSSRECRDDGVGRVAQQVPVILAETGENDCSGEFTLDLLRWADELELSYFVWAWNSWGVCPDDPDARVDNLYIGTDLLTSLDGTPNAFGAKIRDHMISTG